MKTNEKAKELFDEQFKFKLNEEVRHKADGKNNDWGSTAEMGMLVVSRTIQEEADSDGNLIYQRHYHCRLIKLAGSGQIVSFKEQELMSKEEYMTKLIEEKEWSDNVRERTRQIEKEIFESFGIKRGTQIQLTDPAADTNEIYVISGYETSKDGTLISARIKYGEDIKPKSIKLKNKTEFKVLVL